MTSANHQSTDTFVISLGGSLVAPAGGPNTEFLAAFKSIIEDHISQGKRFYIIVGGGNPARQYQAALRELGASDKYLDHVGIFATHMNAYYVALAFQFPPEHKVVLKIEKLRGDANLHITGAGLQPGQSSDTVAVNVATQIGAKTVINLSDIKQVYSSDPNVDSDAKPLGGLNWDEYISIIPDQWQPGLSTPFDPVASRLASARDIDVIVVGSDLKNFASCIDGDAFLGTIISNDYDSTKN